MAATYLQLEGKSGRIYEYSKTEKEGFDKHESSNGNVTYRKYYNTGLYGVLQNVSIRDSKIGEQIQITVKNNGEYLNLQFPLYTVSGSIDNRYAESIIRFLPNLKKGQGYRFYPYAIEQENSTYMNYGVSVIESPNPEQEEKGNKVEPYLTYAKDPKLETDIPNLEWAMKGGKNKPTGASQDAKDEFLFQHLQSAVDGHLAYEKNSSSTPTITKTEKSNSAEKTTTTTTTVTAEEEDEYDDLPF